MISLLCKYLHMLFSLTEALFQPFIMVLCTYSNQVSEAWYCLMSHGPCSLCKFHFVQEVFFGLVSILCLVDTYT